MQKSELTISADQHAKALWRAILKAPGFRPTFAEWWPQRSVILPGAPPQISWVPPKGEEIEKIRDTLEQEIRQYEEQLLQSKGQSKTGLYQTNPNQVFRDVRDPRALPVEVLIAKQKIKVVEVVDQGSILYETSDKIDPTEPVLGDAIPLSIIMAEEGQMWFDKEHSLVEGQEIFQTQKIGTLHKMFDAFGKEWMKRWDKHKNIDDSHWDAIAEFAEQTMPSKSMHIDPITREEFRRIARSKPTAAAVGLDGVSCKDICNLSDSHVDALLSIINHAECTGQWPHQILQGSVHSLQKTSTASTVGEYRPITILSTVYRCWGTIRGRQLLHHLSQFAPEFLHGSVAGKAAVSMWYQIQGRVECSQMDGVMCAGAILDVVKAFNCLPRWPLIRTAIAMGVHKRIIKPWMGFITLLERRFVVRQAYGPGLTSSTGFAEGCPLSVGAMLLCNLVLHRYFTLACPSVHLWSYVDNWELIAEQLEDLVEAIDTIARFASLVDIQIDQAKSLVWATEGEERKRLKQMGHKVTKNIRDLGGHMQFSRQQTNGTVKKKCQELGSLWRRLACSNAPLKCKQKVVRVKAWPRALHAAAGVHIGDHIYESIRAGAFRGCRLNKAGASSKIYWSLCTHSAHDPEGYALLQSIRTFRKQVESFWVSPYLDEISNIPSKQRCPGPLGVVVSRLEQIGWNHVRDALFVDQWGLPVHIGDSPWKEISGRACEAFQINVGQQMTSRHGYQGMQNVNAMLTAQTIRFFDSEAQGLLRALLVGCFITADLYGHSQHLEEEQRQCKFCGAKDSLQHRHWECSHTKESREKIGIDAKDIIQKYPNCLTDRGWAIMPPDLVAFRQALQSIPETSGTFLNEGELPETLDVFTDGAGRERKLQHSRVVGWAWCFSASPWSDNFQVGAAGGVPGIWQTVVRAETYAVLSAVKFSIRTGKDIRIWCDNQQVVNMFGDLQRGRTITCMDNDHDLWGVIQVLLRTADNCVTIHKVFSHQPLDMSDIDNWICRGNAAADRAADMAISQLPPNVLELHEKVSRWIKHFTCEYKAILNHFVRVGKLSVEFGHPTECPKPAVSEPELELDIKAVVQQARLGLPPSLTFPKLSSWIDWLDEITHPAEPVRWVSWFELLVHFQIQTGCIGLKCSNVTWGNHRHWDVVGISDFYDFRKTAKDFAQFGRNVIVKKYPQWKVIQHRPSSPRFHLWCNSIPIRFTAQADSIVQQWFEETGCHGPFKNGKSLDAIPCVLPCASLSSP